MTAPAPRPGPADQNSGRAGGQAAGQAGCQEGRRIRVLAADDQRVVREGLAMLLSLLPDVEVVGTAADGEEAVRLATVTQPDVVLMDLRMPHLDGAAATRRLRERCPDVRVIVLTTYADDRSVIDALRAGARGYLTKDAGAEEIRRALHDVTSGRAVIDPAVQAHLVDAIAAPGNAPTAPAAPASPAGPGDRPPGPGHSGPGHPGPGHRPPSGFAGSGGQPGPHPTRGRSAGPDRRGPVQPGDRRPPGGQ